IVMPNCDRRWMPNHDRFECQTAIDSDAILHTEYFLSFEATRPALLLALVTLVFSASVKSE
ncbi:hypothetical protein, partial [Shigella sonnei]